MEKPVVNERGARGKQGDCFETYVRRNSDRPHGDAGCTTCEDDSSKVEIGCGCASRCEEFLRYFIRGEVPESRVSWALLFQI